MFDKWLKLKDKTPILAMLGTVAANLLPGEPVWLRIVGPPSSAKTELLNSLSKLPNMVHVASTSPAGLLSGTPKPQRHKTAKGGLLNQIGKFGFIVIKEFSSILSLRPDARGELLAALREIHDGAWTRVLGAEGGRS